MNIELSKKELHIIKDLCPNISKRIPNGLPRIDVEIITDVVEMQFSKDIDDVSRRIYADLFRKIVVILDGDEGKSYIEPADDSRVFNFVLREE